VEASLIVVRAREERTDDGESGVQAESHTPTAHTICIGCVLLSLAARLTSTHVTAAAADALLSHMCRPANRRTCQTSENCRAPDLIDIDEFPREADEFGARAMKCGEGAIIMEDRVIILVVCIL
jgi:hypothetical protein